MCGAIRENRSLSKVLIEKSKSLRRREMTFLRKGPVVLIACKDKRIVRMISTIHDTSVKSSGKREKNSIDYTIKPTCILQYNKHMKGLDLANQYLANSSILFLHLENILRLHNKSHIRIKTYVYKISLVYILTIKKANVLRNA